MRAEDLSFSDKIDCRSLAGERQSHAEAGCLISVIMPIHNGARTLGRAIESLMLQSHQNWELLAVDDGSTDDSTQRLSDCAALDRRVRVLRMKENRGPSAARNEGLRHATGSVVAYLDCDDEYYPDFLGHVARLHERADIMFFGYDYVVEDSEQSSAETWMPTAYRTQLFEKNISTPLGVAHRRDLWSKVGGFDEALWCQEDWEFWKRVLARSSSGIFRPDFVRGFLG